VQAGLSRAERLLMMIALPLDSGQFFTQIAIVIGALTGFVFPLLTAVSEFRSLAHGHISIPMPLRKRPAVTQD